MRSKPVTENKRIVAALTLFALLFITAIVLPYAKRISGRFAGGANVPAQRIKRNTDREAHMSDKLKFVEPEPQQSAQFDLSRNVIAGGGGTSSNGTVRLDGTVGQQTAGTTSSNGQFAVTGGFWRPESAVSGTPSPTPTATPTPTPTATPTPTPTVQFSSSLYVVGEGDLRVNLTVTRSGDTSGAASVGYATIDDAGLTNCNVFNGIASPRCDYIVTIGTLSFTAGETSKSFSVAIIDDSYAEGNENFRVMLNNPAGASLGSPSITTVMIVDNETTTGPNPIDSTNFFVRQQYLDFLGREPDPGGFAAWVGIINGCAPNDTSCDRVHVSQDFFQSPEFQGRGYFIYRFYPVSFPNVPNSDTPGYGHKPDYAQFVPDLARVSGFLDANQLEAAKVAFIADFMARPAFANTYSGLTNQQYVDMLLSNANAGNSASARQGWIDGLNNSTLTRAQVLRQIAESTEAYNKYYNPAFVIMQYFGYLRRDPDAAYTVWIQVMNQSNDPRGMITGFVNSTEYRQRFGP